MNEGDEIMKNNNMEMFSREVQNQAIVAYSAGTTGHCGGDSGHGGRTIISISIDSGDFSFKINDNTLTIKAGGDGELDNLIEGLDFVARTLKVLRDSNL